MTSLANTTRMSWPEVDEWYPVALAEYVAGKSADPPCEGCADPIPEGAMSGARLCLDCSATLMNTEFMAPRTRTNRRWKWNGRTLGERLRLMPQGLDVFAPGGGVRAIWVTLDELRKWMVIA